MDLQVDAEAMDVDRRRAGRREPGGGARDGLEWVDAAPPGSAPATARPLPNAMGPGSVVRLQRLAGNQATRTLLRAVELQRQCVEEEPAGPGSGTQATDGAGQLPAAAAQSTDGPGQTSPGETDSAETSPGETSPGETSSTGTRTEPSDAGGVVDSAAPDTTTPPAPADTTAGPGTPPASAHRQLSWGSQGPDVIDLQQRLNAAGSATPPLAQDGIFGPLTNAAVRQYQGAHPPLKVDGIVGPKTWAVLDTPGGGGGGGGGPVPTDPLAGICTINGHGASDAAVNRAREQAIELYGNLAPANRARMAADPITVDVIPHDKKLTELPEYQHLAGTQTFDGRLWDNVRGIQTEVNGVRRVAVAEEDLTTVTGKNASYGSGFLEAHEGGHGLQFSGLTVAQQAQLQGLYAARLAGQGQPTQTTPEGPATAGWLRPAWYSAANKEEYFANSVAAYHGHPYTDGAADVAQYTRAWLQANDPQMYALIDSVYVAAPAPGPGTTAPGGTP